MCLGRVGVGVGWIVGDVCIQYVSTVFLEEEDVFVLSSLLLCKVDMN